ncbi:MAG: hypothetical protein JNK14_11865 [Chitinophagaceae bacterium]|nr:hypothetical protein [Chitinophagaceae bacterium]
MSLQSRPGLSGTIRPYLLLSIIGILAFLPVSFMLRSLKNDIVAIEYPINYFISQCIHNGEISYWFNTWGLGFPLHSGLTWGIYSTPQMIFCSLFDYNLYTLHIEFMFFLLAAGWGMYYLLKKYIIKDENIAWLLAVCYMLSGFMVGSTQWLLYITAASFLPFVIACLLRLFQDPCLKNTFLLAVVYTLMFTSVYAAFTIIATYALLVFAAIYLYHIKGSRRSKMITAGYLSAAALLALLLCGPCIYYTAELLNYIERGRSIENNAGFFNSNYVHPAALSNMLLPFSSVRMSFANTEGTMIHSYAGLFVLLLLPAAIIKTISEKNKAALLILSASLLFLLLSFGGMTPVRDLFNILPGFSFFRNPAIFRLFFILTLLLYFAMAWHDYSFRAILDLQNPRFTKAILSTAGILAIIFLIVLLGNIQSFAAILTGSLQSAVKNISLSQTLLVSSCIQLLILLAVWNFARIKKIRLVKWVLASDLVINTLICTPFFSVSSYTLDEVNTILHSKEGFPVQTVSVSDAPATFTDPKGNRWFNINVFNKEFSAADSYRGPLTLNQFYRLYEDTGRALYTSWPLLFAETGETGNIHLLLQKPAHISASVDFQEPATITLLQNNYPGWKVFYNDRRIDTEKNNKAGITVSIPAGKGTLDFKYERNFAWLSALLLHFIIISYFVWQALTYLVRKKTTPSSLS